MIVFFVLRERFKDLEVLAAQRQTGFRGQRIAQKHNVFNLRLRHFDTDFVKKVLIFRGGQPEGVVLAAEGIAFFLCNEHRNAQRIALERHEL